LVQNQFDSCLIEDVEGEKCVAMMLSGLSSTTLTSELEVSEDGERLFSNRLDIFTERSEIHSTNTIKYKQHEITLSLFKRPPPPMQRGSRSRLSIRSTSITGRDCSPTIR